MKIEKRLDRLHLLVTKNRWLQIFTAFTRVLLAIGFIPPSIPKILGQPFTTLPDSNPVGHFFNALFQTGYYYRFIGVVQITAAVLLLIPRTSHLGAVLFFPIILNIAVLTNSVGFTGTWLIADLMFLAALYLVCWDYDRIKTMLFFRRESKSAFLKYEYVWLPLLFAFGGTVGYVLLTFFLFRTNAFLKPVFLLVLFGLGAMLGLIVALHHRFMLVGESSGKSK